MRLVTRADFDGLVCGVLLAEKGVVEEYTFVQPKDVQDGKVEVTKNDVLANVPFVPACGMWFDHHVSEVIRLRPDIAFEGANLPAKSAAQLIWDYYGGEDAFAQRLRPLLEAVNKSDSGDLTREDITDPRGWMLLSFVVDPRTGLGRFEDFTIGTEQLMEDMIQYCRTKGAEEILEIPDVKQRTARYLEQRPLFEEMLRAHSRVDGNVIVTDLRPCETTYAGNRFLIFALYPEQNIELRVMWGEDRRDVVFACGHSVLNRTSRTNVGALMLKHGGGGHDQVGTCRASVDDAERVCEELIAQLHADG